MSQIQISLEIGLNKKFMPIILGKKKISPEGGKGYNTTGPSGSVGRTYLWIVRLWV